ncbi:11634_t:CDS:10 [Cetraspora pellucida]|uniref:11634_t:CDS:1 n=1 Tax=Cetraspora pellucida TaxID=1433469 RepID=A0ACA9LLQ8_9GLOM|nr:11634_t:CDS:10 [Cetraspora pellucida]
MSSSNSEESESESSETESSESESSESESKDSESNESESKDSESNDSESSESESSGSDHTSISHLNMVQMTKGDSVANLDDATQRTILTNRWLERNALEKLGIKYKKGKFSKQERSELIKALRDYQQLNSLSDDDIKKLIYGRNPKVHENFWKHLAMALGTRPLKTVSQHIQRRYHPFNYTGTWSPEEDNELIKLVNIHHHDWVTIGNELGRMGTQCRDRWRDYVQYRKEKLRGRWTDEEEQKLINIVVELTRQNDADISLDWGIPWQQVSSLMENTRSPNQCRAKWVKELRLQYELDGPAPRWTSYDSYTLIKKLYESQKDDETSVDWNDLNDERWGPWTPGYLMKIWNRLKYTIKDFNNKSFKDNVIELLDRYAKRPPKKGYRSRMIIEPEDSDDDQLGND